MLLTFLGYIEIKAYHFTLPNMGGGKNRPIEVSLWDTHFEWKIVEMINLIGKIRFEVCG